MTPRRIPMTLCPRCRPVWRTARDVATLGDLCARWLEGTLCCQPAYGAALPPYPETAPLVPQLAALNRAGLFTTCSQPGSIGFERSGLVVREQRAAVEAFATSGIAGAVTAAARNAGLAVVAYDPATLPAIRFRRRRQVTATRVDGTEVTWFGQQISRDYITGAEGWGDCHPAAVAALCASWQVTVTDPVWGRSDLLWDTLTRAIAPAVTS